MVALRVTFWSPTLKVAEAAAAAVVVAAAVTIRVVEPVMLPSVALMVLVPDSKAVASPWLPDALEIVATAVSDEAQVTCG